MVNSRRLHKAKHSETKFKLVLLSTKCYAWNHFDSFHSFNTPKATQHFSTERLLSRLWGPTVHSAEHDWVLTDCAAGFAAIWVKFISTDGTSFECSSSDKYGRQCQMLLRPHHTHEVCYSVFNCPAFSESCCFWVPSFLCDPRLNENIAFLSLPNMVIQTKNVLLLFSY